MPSWLVIFTVNLGSSPHISVLLESNLQAHGRLFSWVVSLRSVFLKAPLFTSPCKHADLHIKPRVLLFVLYELIAPNIYRLLINILLDCFLSTFLVQLCFLCSIIPIIWPFGPMMSVFFDPRMCFWYVITSGALLRLTAIWPGGCFLY